MHQRLPAFVFFKAPSSHQTTAVFKQFISAASLVDDGGYVNMHGVFCSVVTALSTLNVSLLCALGVYLHFQVYCAFRDIR